MTDVVQVLDPLPIAFVFVAFGVVTLLAFEIGFRIGRWWQERTPDEKEGPTAMLVGSLLALLAFLLAVTMGMAADRFEVRRSLVLQEANSIGTTFLRAGYLPDPASTASRELLREYVPLRIGASRADLITGFSRSTDIHAELWTIAEDLARGTPDSEVLGLYIASLNETIDLHETRVAAVVYGRVPETVLMLLIVGAAVTLAMVGYSAGLTRKRSLLSAIVLVVVLGAVITLIIDLDRPRRGLILVSQQPLIDLQEQIGPPGS